MHPLVSDLSKRLGPDVAIAMGDAGAALYPVEEQAIATAIAKRQTEFRSGRGAARAAMAMVGQPPVAVPKGADRAPVWPAGIVGSITHTVGLCFAAVGQVAKVSAIGIDAEQANPLSDAVRSAVLCDATEQDLDGLDATTVFSAKESTYKALSPWLDEVWGFDAMRIELSQSTDSFSAILCRPAGPLTQGTRLSGVALRDKHHIVTACCLVSS